jgi:hypothetical protein
MGSGLLVEIASRSAFFGSLWVSLKPAILPFKGYPGFGLARTFKEQISSSKLSMVCEADNAGPPLRNSTLA